MTTVHEHEYFKMMRAREDRIKTFMQLELEASLEEASWSIRCYNCEVLGCPQEEYPARLLPTLPPSYEDNLQSRLIMHGTIRYISASLKMILKSEYQLPVLRLVPEISVQPDSVIGEHRAGENSTSSESDPSPRRATVVTRSEEPGTPPHSPAISTGSGSKVSQAETQMEEDLFLFATSRDVFLRSKCTSLEEYYILRKFNQKSGWTTATTQTLHKPPPARSLRDYFLASSKGWQHGQPTKANSWIGEDFCDEKFLSSEEIFCLYCLCFVFFPLVFLSTVVFRIYPALPPKQV